MIVHLINSETADIIKYKENTAFSAIQTIDLKKVLLDLRFNASLKCVHKLKMCVYIIETTPFRKIVAMSNHGTPLV